MRKGISVTIEPREAYDELIRRSRELATLASCSAVLGWDEQTYMPTGGAAHRGNQMALLAGLHHERATDPRIGELLAIVEGSALSAEPDSVEAVNIRELRRSYDRRVRLPRALVEELARTTSMAQSEWVAARAASDFGRFRPWLEKIVQLKREESACLAGHGPGRWGRRARGLGLRSLARRVRAGGHECRPGRPVRRPAARAGAPGGGDRRGQPRARPRPGGGAGSTPRPPTARRSSSDLTRAIGSGSSARRWPRRWASTSGAGGWT